jgi:anti-sigma factor RsiW
MLLKAEDEQLMISYLLGELTDEQRTEVERRYFDDDDWFECLTALEEELIRDYLRNELSPERRARFEARYLAVEELKQRVEESRVLMEAMPPAVAAPAKSSWWASFIPLPAPAYALAACAVAALGLGIWLARENSRLKGELSEYGTALAALREQIGQSRPQPVTASFLLIPGLTRGAGGAGRLSLTPAVEQVELKLELRGPSASAVFRVSVQTLTGAEVSSQEVQPDGRFLVLRLPAANLEEDTYIVRVQEERPDGQFSDLDSYTFSVLRPD